VDFWGQTWVSVDKHGQWWTNVDTSSKDIVATGHRMATCPPFSQPAAMLQSFPEVAVPTTQLGFQYVDLNLADSS